MDSANKLSARPALGKNTAKVSENGMACCRTSCGTGSSAARSPITELVGTVGTFRGMFEGEGSLNSQPSSENELEAQGSETPTAYSLQLPQATNSPTSGWPLTPRSPSHFCLKAIQTLQTSNQLLHEKLPACIMSDLSVSHLSELLPASGVTDASHFWSSGAESSAKLARQSGHLP